VRGIVFYGPIYGGSGYAEDNLDIVLELVRRGIPVQVIPYGATSDPADLLEPRVREQLEALVACRLDLRESLFLQSVPAGAFLTEMRGRITIGRTTFETDRLPAGWVERCNALDEVWVPSEFNRETFQHSGVEAHRLRVMPEGVDTRLFCPGWSPLPLAGRRGFNFLSIFDWQDRKGAEILLEAYVSEFRPDEDVALLLKVTTHNRPGLDLDALVLEFLEGHLGRRLDQVPPIVLVTGMIPRRQLPRLYAAADAFVLATRGEGWGRPLAEALACERPVIATAWGGQMDFLHEGNSFLIAVERLVPVSPAVDLEIFAGHRWAEPSRDHLRQLMRTVFTQRAQAGERARRGRREMVERWDARRVAARLADALLTRLEAA
jgi:glycosyltransferase involved in cell wall biosynthesis